MNRYIMQADKVARVMSVRIYTGSKIIEFSYSDSDISGLNI
jgi:hypothetical protein